MRRSAGVDAALRDASSRVSGPTEDAPPRTTASALRRAPGAIALISVPGPVGVRRGDGRRRGRPRRDDLQRQRPGRAGAGTQAGRRRPRGAGDGAGLRHRRRRRASGSASRTWSPPVRSASSPPPAPAASRCCRCSTTRGSGSARRWASAAGTCPPRSAGWPPARRCAAWTRTPRVELIVLVSKPPTGAVGDEITAYADVPGHPGRAGAARAGSSGPDRRRPSGSWSGSTGTCRTGRSSGQRPGGLVGTDPRVSSSAARCARRHGSIAASRCRAHVRGLRRRRVHHRPGAPDDRPHAPPGASGPGGRRPGHCRAAPRRRPRPRRRARSGGRPRRRRCASVGAAGAGRRGRDRR